MVGWNYPDDKGLGDDFSADGHASYAAVTTAQRGLSPAWRQAHHDRLRRGVLPGSAVLSRRAVG